MHRYRTDFHSITLRAGYLLAPEAAAEWLVRAIRTRPIAPYPRFAALMRIYGALFPTAADRALLMAS